MALFGKIEKRASVPNLTATALGWEDMFPGWFKKTNSGRTVSRDGALRMMAVWACVSLIADGIASLPTEVYRDLPDGRSKLVTNAPAFTQRPNPYQTPYDFWHRVIVSLLLDGNAFLYTERDDEGNVLALYCLEPRSVFIIQGANGNDLYDFAGQQYDRSQILHIPAFVIPGWSRGLSPIDAAAEAIGLGLTAEEFGARFFGQGTAMAGIIEHPGAPKPDEASMLREMFRKTHAGTKNSHAVGVLTGGASFKPITIPPDQAQFLETRKFQKTEISLLYRVPHYMLDPEVTSSWGKGIEEQHKWFIDQTLMPWIVRIEQAISIYLLPGKQRLRFNLDARLRAKTQERYASYETAVNNGFMCIDEVRAAEGLDPLPKGEGKIFWRPLNMAPIDQAKKPTPKPQNTPGENAPGGKSGTPDGKVPDDVNGKNTTNPDGTSQDGNPSNAVD